MNSYKKKLLVRLYKSAAIASDSIFCMLIMIWLYNIVSIIGSYFNLSDSITTVCIAILVFIYLGVFIFQMWPNERNLAFKLKAFPNNKFLNRVDLKCRAHNITKAILRTKLAESLSLDFSDLEDGMIPPKYSLRFYNEACEAFILNVRQTIGHDLIDIKLVYDEVKGDTFGQIYVLYLFKEDLVTLKLMLE